MADEDAFERLMGVFVNADGQLAWPLEQVEHILPWCLLHMPVDLGDLDEGTVALFARTCQRAGVPAGADPEATREVLEAWYVDHPPAAELAAALEAAWLEVNAAPAPGQNPFAKFTGASGPSGVLGGGVRPEGTTPGGPLARMARIPPKKGRDG